MRKNCKLNRKRWQVVGHAITEKRNLENLIQTNRCYKNGCRNSCLVYSVCSHSPYGLETGVRKSVRDYAIKIYLEKYGEYELFGILL